MIGLFNLGGFEGMMGDPSEIMWGAGSSPAVGGIFLVIAAAALLFYLSMLVDCLRMPDNKFPAKGKNDKLIWAITILWLSLIGAILYWLMVKKNSRKR